MKSGLSLLIRAIPTVVSIITVLSLSFWWTRDSGRGLTFVFFVFLMIYASVMCFYGDFIFMNRKRAHVKMPVAAVAGIHAAYAVALIVLYSLFGQHVDTIYFILSAFVATGIQLSLTLALVWGASRVAGQQGELDQRANVRVMREVFLNDLKTAFKASSTLSGDHEIMRKLNVLCNSWQTSAPKDTEASAATTAKIEAALETMLEMAEKPDVDIEAVTAQFAKITSLIDGRNKLLTLK